MPESSSDQPRRRVQRRDAAPAAQAPTMTPAERAAERRIRSVGTRRGAVADFEPLSPDDASIPYDRVPYVPGDLRRVLAMAAVMIVLIIIAALIVPHVVG